MRSADGVNLIECHNLRPDIVYLDADHSGSAVLFELTKLFPLLKDDGIIYGDDFSFPNYAGRFRVKNNDFLGLRDAVMEFCRTNGLPLQLYGESPANRNFIIRKKQRDTYQRTFVQSYPLDWLVNWPLEWPLKKN